MAFTGFSESLNFSLCSRDDVTTFLKKKKDEKAVEIGNPKSQEFQVGRTSLLPGLLKNLASNKKNKVPFKLFELGDVIYLQSREENPNADEFIGAKNRRKLAVVYTNATTSGLDIIHGVLDMIMTKMFKNQKDYTLKENKQPYFLHNLQSSIYIGNELVGEMGILHPEVLKRHTLVYPTSYLEIDFESLCSML